MCVPSLAADDRGIDVVRNKIKMFATKKVTLPPGKHKIVILDEADRWGRPGRGTVWQRIILHVSPAPCMPAA